MERLVDAWNCLDVMWRFYILLPVITAGMIAAFALIIIVDKKLYSNVLRYRTCMVSIKAAGLRIGSIGERLSNKYPKIDEYMGWLFGGVMIVCIAWCVILFFIATYQSVVCYLDVG